MGQNEVDIPQLFNDVSRTISGITNIMGAGTSQDSLQREKSGSAPMVANLFGNTCFKACGMEDIQYAARSAGDMLITLRTCIMASTAVFLLCMVIFTATTLYIVFKKTTSRRFPLPAFVRDALPARQETTKESHHT
ncbi:hypothetical protein DICVIV_05112 [Dictyocaulus viviparus]|uniref:Uncharacterized protein n=1 Tax=Dictyocaulus viviparus TaxID=29172 RepID=A0A0D8XY94_DICVI|nr:hypothetical protein DICVIV_05112 [Dictyocaulus viviparus]